MDTKQIGQAGLVGLRGKVGRKVADGVGKRTRLDAEKIAALIGAYLFVSRARRMVQMLRRMRRAA
ncbi:MAG: hypothetical protein H0V11_06010 [Actinobacteria bacterium]|nr:hypothetical protein [Actinomycetota bacterium]